MKKKILLVVIIIISIVLILSLNLLAKPKENINIDIIELANILKNTSIFEDKLSDIDKEIVYKNYDFNQENIKNIISYVSSGATAEEILIIEINDKTNINETKNKIETRIEERKADYQNYLPKEVYKLENDILKIKGNYIILCVSNDSDKANEIINNYLKN